MYQDNYPYFDERMAPAPPFGAGMGPGGMMPGGAILPGMGMPPVVPGTTASSVSPGIGSAPGGSPTPISVGTTVPPSQLQQTFPLTQPGVSTSPFETAPGSPTALGIEYTQGYLKTLIGQNVRVEFLFGENSLQDRRGKLLSVGIDYIILLESDTDDELLCDIYGIKFVTVYK